MVSLITQKSLEQKHAPAEWSIKYADGRFEGHINWICVWNIYFPRFVWNVSIEIQIAWKNLILLCNINSLCLTHHQSWQQHLNKTLQFSPSFLSSLIRFLQMLCKDFKDKMIYTYPIKITLTMCALVVVVYFIAGIISANFGQIGITAHVNIDCWLYIFSAYLNPSLIICIINVNSGSPWWEKLNLEETFFQIKCMGAERNVDSVPINFI